MQQLNSPDRTLRPLVLLIALSFLLHACGSDSGNLQSPASETAAGDESESKASEEQFVAGQNVAEIELEPGPDAAGPKPRFAWKAVSDTDYYVLALFDNAGNTYWVWIGSEPQVYLGGTQDLPDENAEGPRLVEPMTWTVVAFDAEGNLVASSAVQSISP